MRLDQMYFFPVRSLRQMLQCLLYLDHACLYVLVLFSNNNESKKHISNYLCLMSVITWHSRRTADICFKFGLPYSSMFPSLFVGIKIVLKVEPA